MRVIAEIRADESPRHTCQEFLFSARGARSWSGFRKGLAQKILAPRHEGDTAGRQYHPTAKAIWQNPRDSRKDLVAVHHNCVAAASAAESDFGSRQVSPAVSLGV